MKIRPDRKFLQNFRRRSAPAYFEINSTKLVPGPTSLVPLPNVPSAADAVCWSGSPVIQSPGLPTCLPCSRLRLPGEACAASNYWLPRTGGKNFTTKLPRTTLGTGLARTGTNTGILGIGVASEQQPYIEPYHTPTHGNRDAMRRACRPRGPRMCQVPGGVRGVRTPATRCTLSRFSSVQFQRPPPGQEQTLPNSAPPSGATRASFHVGFAAWHSGVSHEAVAE